MNFKSPTIRAAAAMLLFVSVGMLGWYFTGGQNSAAYLLLSYYAVLVINTFFSVWALTAITPPNTTQTAFDLILILFYGALAFAFGSVTSFAGISLALFLVSIVKYWHLSRLIGATPLVLHKIRLNTLAALLSCVSFGISFVGFPLAGAWILATTFILASMYLLITDPMYRIEQPH